MPPEEREKISKRCIYDEENDQWKLKPIAENKTLVYGGLGSLAAVNITHYVLIQHLTSGVMYCVNFSLFTEKYYVMTSDRNTHVL